MPGTNDFNSVQSATLGICNMESQLGNRFKGHIYCCKSNGCSFKNDFKARDLVASSFTHRMYECVVPRVSVYVNDNSENVIYLITCNNFHLQYVRETV